MAKFDKLLGRVSRTTYDTKEAYEKALNELKRVQGALEYGMSIYANKELLNDFSAPWYANAREHYESRYDKITKTIRQLQERHASFQTGEGNPEVQGVLVDSEKQQHDAGPKEV